MKKSIIYKNLFFSPQILRGDYDYVLDAVDHAIHKCHILDFCKKRNIKVLTTGGTAGADNPFSIEVIDLAFVEHNRLVIFRAFS